MTNLDIVSIATPNVPNCHINLIDIPKRKVSPAVWRRDERRLSHRASLSVNNFRATYAVRHDAMSRILNVVENSDKFTSDLNEILKFQNLGKACLRTFSSRIIKNFERWVSVTRHDFTSDDLEKGTRRSQRFAARRRKIVYESQGKIHEVGEFPILFPIIKITLPRQSGWLSLTMPAIKALYSPLIRVERERERTPGCLSAGDFASRAVCFLSE